MDKWLPLSSLLFKDTSWDLLVHLCIRGPTRVLWQIPSSGDFIVLHHCWWPKLMEQVQIRKTLHKLKVHSANDGLWEMMLVYFGFV